jgi:hypothetical protein
MRPIVRRHGLRERCLAVAPAMPITVSVRLPRAKKDRDGLSCLSERSPNDEPARSSEAIEPDKQDKPSRSFLARGSRILRRQGSKINIVATLDEEDEACINCRGSIESTISAVSSWLALTVIGMAGATAKHF